MAIIMAESKNPRTWCEDDMDSVLIKGDDFYKELRKSVSNDYVSLLDLTIVTSAQIGGQNYQMDYILNEGEALYGLLYSSTPSTEVSLFTLHAALSMLFNMQCNACLLVLEEYTVAVLESDRDFFVFDSHSRDARGMVSESGTSTLMYVGNTYECVAEFIKHLALSLGLQKKSRFEVMGVRCKMIDSSLDKDILECSASQGISYIYNTCCS